MLTQKGDSESSKLKADNKLRNLIPSCSNKKMIVSLSKQKHFLYASNEKETHLIYKPEKFVMAELAASTKLLTNSRSPSYGSARQSHQINV